MHASQDLHNVLIILAAAVLVVPIFQRLRSSPVLGYLVAGMLIGPSGLGIVSDVSGVVTLANFGVVFLLFTIGLELSIERLKAIRSHVFGLGTLQVVLTAGLFWLAARWLGQPRETAVILAGGLALSSTAIVLQILVERGEMPTRHGRVSFAILLLQDLAVVPLLTLVPLLASHDTRLAGALGLAGVKAVGTLIVILIVGRLILRPALRVVASAKSPELFTGVTLLVVLGVSYVTELAGLSMALGAFLAGLLIAETEYRHQVEGDIEPFRGILLALFFMTIGMSIDLVLIKENAIIVLMLVTALVAGKAIVMTALCRAFGFPIAVSTHVGLSLGQGGEFAFVLFSLAMTLGVMPLETGQMMLAVVALSMALTPFLMTAGRRLAVVLTPKIGVGGAAADGGRRPRLQGACDHRRIRQGRPDRGAPAGSAAASLHGLRPGAFPDRRGPGARSADLLRRCQPGRGAEGRRHQPGARRRGDAGPALGRRACRGIHQEALPPARHPCPRP